MRVLICDDNRDAAQTLELLMGLQRHDTFICDDGAACIVKARAWRPHIALLDIGMPGTNGYEVARAIRALDFGAEVFLIAITGWDTQRDVDDARDAGFDLHIAKPADPGRLLDVVAGVGARR